MLGNEKLWKNNMEAVFNGREGGEVTQVKHLELHIFKTVCQHPVSVLTVEENYKNIIAM